MCISYATNYQSLTGADPGFFKGRGVQNEHMLLGIQNMPFKFIMNMYIWNISQHNTNK